MSGRIPLEPGGALEAAARKARAVRRDAFAAAALAGMMADDDLTAAISVEDLARRAWAFADAMLEQDPERDEP